MSGATTPLDPGHREPTGSPEYDVIVVGAGIAGLSAAWLLRDRNVLLLERDDRVGGRILSMARDPYWVNLGAHLVQLSGGPLVDYARALNVPLVVPKGSFAAVAMKGRIIRADRPEVLPFRLPLPMAARASLVRSGLRLRLADRRLAKAHKAAEGRVDVLAIDEHYDQVTYAEVLGPLHPEVAALMRVTANRLGTEPSMVSADRGVSHTMETWASRRANVVGGTGALTTAMAAALGDRVRTSSGVQFITQTDGEVTVELDRPGRPERLTAAACIVTVPAPIVREIVQGLTRAKSDALAQLPYGPYVTAGIFTNETGPMPWDDVYAVAAPGQSFCMLFNPANPYRTGPRRPGGSIVAYSAGDKAADQLSQSDAAITDQFLRDLYATLPAAKGIVREVVIKRWPLGVPLPQRGRARLQPALTANHGRVYFAGDYLIDQGIDSAAWTAETAVNEVRTLLAGDLVH